MALPDGSDNQPPEWIHLTPAGTFGGKDGRGPFTLKNAAAVIERSMHMARGKIVVDINHSTHVAAARGERSDAVGWITELNARADGIWGRVEWNGTGRQLMADHAYRGISPAIGSASDGTVEWIEAVSLTNRPNLGVADLHSQNQETRMDLAQLRRTLGLSETATEDDINAAIARGKAAVTLHASVAKAVGLDANADDAAVLTAYSNLGVPQGSEAVGPAWYLFCTRRPLKPMIYQPRRPFVVTAKTQITAGNVFSGNEFLWGVDGRCNAGLGMYQFAYRSTRPLNGDTFADALAAMASQRRKDGSPYGIRPDLLVVPQNLESAGRQLLNGDMVPVEAPDGKTWIPGANVWKGACDLLVAPRLSQKVGG